ncbi:hypothetical protein PTSG_08848 [Salpingoeca rosetta]|uniref:Alginate lyase domain-containing protein n=1 Tax=Salpingoeca rosetta (strain ATCC 50818 / BSB-021) TaxID=946362 RepID=F2UKW0_SALR5|nr:uncharacterized protein PTSG_08848 [Salpingoeca rosetta]EGD77759.1 hypothetical protein PTSG_08848 [Salpingoeca rosetta]|eukprot:XP_004990235.1 hypothetical protein PTSG_08848 [Salpingoeca rosetta]
MTMVDAAGTRPGSDPSGAAALNNKTHLWLQSDLADAKQRLEHGELATAFESLQHAAESALTDTEWTVLNKTLVPASGDMRDYVSIAIYNWPCNATPSGCKPYPGSHWPKCNNKTGLPWRACDGIVDKHAVNAGDSPHASKTRSNAISLALIFALTGNATYADKACRVLDKWFLDARTAMNPNLAYGQGTPGINNGSHGSMIEWTSLAETIDAAVLLQSADCWLQSTLAAKFQAWLSALLDFIWITGAHEMDGERYMKNNHGTWYDSTVLSLALGAMNKNVGLQIAGNVSSLRIAHQIEPSGRMPEETGRNNGASYSIYNMQAFTNVAALADWFGYKFWSYETHDGRSIRKALDFLIPFALYEAPWPFSQATEALNFNGLVGPLRHASIALNNRTYEVVACRIFNDTRAYADQQINLLKPPLFNVTQDECTPLPPVPRSWLQAHLPLPFFMRGS